jgi:hypothetical protein
VICPFLRDWPLRENFSLFTVKAHRRQKWLGWRGICQIFTNKLYTQEIFPARIIYCCNFLRISCRLYDFPLKNRVLWAIWIISSSFLWRTNFSSTSYTPSLCSWIFYALQQAIHRKLCNNFPIFTFATVSSYITLWWAMRIYHFIDTYCYITVEKYHTWWQRFNFQHFVAF